MSVKIRGNRDSTLPIEDWAKGLTKAFGRRKSVAAPKASRAKHSTQKQDVQSGLGALGYDESIYTRRSSSFCSSTREEPVVPPMPALNGPIENWMNTLPVRAPGLKPRNPLRVSTNGRPSTSVSSTTGENISGISPSDAGSAPTDWSSDFERELPSSNPFYSRHAQDLVAALSTIPGATPPIIEESAEIPPLFSGRKSNEPQSSAGASAAGTQVSLRSVFFPGSTGSRERAASLSLTSSDVAEQRRRLSTVSSVATFTTANDGSDCAIEDEDEEPNNDTGIDEDYTKRVEPEEAEEVHEYKVQHELLDQKMAEETVVELKNDDYITRVDEHPGTLEDVLISVALSSPYASSESDVSSQAGSQDESQHGQPEELFTETSSGGSVSLPDTDSLESPISISSGSIQECRRVRPARHYKMINGLIVQYDPWRIPGQYESSRCSDASDFASSISDRSFQRSGFMNSGNRWTHAGLQTGIMV